jgi:hypothetical protein
MGDVVKGECGDSFACGNTEGGYVRQCRVMMNGHLPCGLYVDIGIDGVWPIVTTEVHHGGGPGVGRMGWGRA